VPRSPAAPDRRSPESNRCTNSAPLDLAICAAQPFAWPMLQLPATERRALSSYRSAPTVRQLHSRAVATER
jgi:hypothetical protein